MQTARQTAHNPRTSRSKMIAAIHLQWRNMRPDLRHSPEELRDERLAFITDLLKLKRPLSSMRSLSDRQLGIVLDALNSGRVQTRLPNSQPAPEPASGSAEIIHLASAEQVFAINKILDYLRWRTEAREKFIQQRFNRTSPAMLSPKDANSLVMILLTVAAARDVRHRTGAARVSRKMIHAEIPQLKIRVGIDMPQSAEREI